MIWNPFNKPPKKETKETTKNMRVLAATFLTLLGTCERVDASDQLPEKATPVEWVDFLAKKSSAEGDNFESHVASICNTKDMDCTTIASEGSGFSVGMSVIEENTDFALKKYEKVGKVERKDFILFSAHNHPYKVVDRLKEEFNPIQFPERSLTGPSGSGDCLVPSTFVSIDKDLLSREINLVVDTAGVWVCSSTNYQDSFLRPKSKEVIKIRSDLFIASQTKQGKDLDEAIKTFESEFYRILKVKVKFMKFGFTNQELVDTALEIMK